MCHIVRWWVRLLYFHIDPYYFTLHDCLVLNLVPFMILLSSLLSLMHTSYVTWILSMPARSLDLTHHLMLRYCYQPRSRSRSRGWRAPWGARNRWVRVGTGRSGGWAGSWSASVGAWVIPWFWGLSDLCCEQGGFTHMVCTHYARGIHSYGLYTLLSILWDSLDLCPATFTLLTLTPN